MTELLCREVPFELRDDEEGDGNTLVGYAAVFNSPTRINSWEGVFDEDIDHGAFSRSLAERTPVLQFDHGKHPMVGSIPLGYWERIEPDSHGLFVRAPLHDNWLVQPVRDAIKSKAIPGMSFRFAVVADLWRTAAGREVKQGDVERMLMRTNPADPSTILRRSLLDVDLFEAGPVVFPAYGDTTVGLRSRELASLLSDPQVRAELARILVGTPSEEPRDAKGASGNDGLGDAMAAIARLIPSKAARDRGLIVDGVKTS